jgi:MFS family permease
MNDSNNMDNEMSYEKKMLFWACFVAIAVTAFIFIIRGQVINAWAQEFSLTETQKGEILGVGLWPFAISIILFSLVIDFIGYGKAMAFAFYCHILSGIILLMADGYWGLYIGTFLQSLANGAAQAVADPVVASSFKKDKSKWLSILHASWPGGMVIGGMFGIMISDFDWRWRISMLFIPMVIYGLMMIGRKFPVHERVLAGVSYKEMLKVTGGLGFFVISILVFGEIGRILLWPNYIAFIAAAGIALYLGYYLRSIGNPIFLLLLFIMIPLATTELGTDSWITSLMTDEMKSLSINAGWVLIYTSFIMMVLRFVAGPLLRYFTPLGLLAACSFIATIGLAALSKTTGLMIFVAATLYGVGKTYFWPMMLGVVAERFPKGGALALNTMSAVGMLSVGILGTVFLGNIQDRAIETQLKKENPVLSSKILTEKTSIIGEYEAIDPDLRSKLNEDEQQFIGTIEKKASKNALLTVAIFPIIMLISYIFLIYYFKRRGGYKVVDLQETSA